MAALPESQSYSDSVTSPSGLLEAEQQPRTPVVGENHGFRQWVSPTARDWEDHRSVIADLYITRNMTLKEVKEVMHKRGFFAT